MAKSMVVFLSQSGTFGVEKPAYAGIFGLRVGGFGQTTGATQNQPEQLFLVVLHSGCGTVFEKNEDRWQYVNELSAGCETKVTHYYYVLQH